jgi:hypothetical protein
MTLICIVGGKYAAIGIFPGKDRRMPMPSCIASLRVLSNYLTLSQVEYKELEIGNNSSMRFKMINVNRIRQIWQIVLIF